MNVKEIQRGLALVGLYVSPIDGIDGPKTQRAQHEFRENEGVKGDIAKALESKIKQLAVEDYTSSGGGGLASVVKRLCTDLYHEMPQQWTYIMATVEHETNATFFPVEEAYYLNESQQERHLKGKRYYPYYGRGLVQLTWEFNYRKYSEILGLDLVGNPEYALDASISLFVLVHGMLTGTFTGLPLNKYVNAYRVDYDGARRVVNGTDAAATIAELAKKWEKYYE